MNGNRKGKIHYKWNTFLFNVWIPEGIIIDLGVPFRDMSRQAVRSPRRDPVATLLLDDYWDIWASPSFGETISHMLHVWYIYQHLGDLLANVGKYSVHSMHGAMGIIPNPSSTTLCGNIDRGFSFIPWAYGIIPSLYIQVSSCSLPSMVPSSCFGQQKRYPRIRWSQNVKMGCI